MMDAKKLTGCQLVSDGDNDESKYFEMEKSRFLLEVLRNENAISKFCVEKGISTDILVQWKKDILESDKVEMKVLRNSDSKKEIERLEIENTYLRQLIAGLRIENDKLRKN